MKYCKGALIASFLILAACTVQATSQRYGNFLESAADAVLKVFSELSRRLVYTGWMWSKMNEVKYDLYDNLQHHLTNKPDIGEVHISSVTEYFVRLLQPVYVAAIIATAIYLMTQPSSPYGRSKAKSILVKLLVGIFIISMTVPIVKLIIQTSDSFTKSILSQGPLDIGFTYKKAADYLGHRAAEFMWADISMGLPFLALALLSTAGVYVVLTLRFFFIIFLTIFFPVAVFLGLFTPTRNIGHILIKHLFYWAFLPAGYALVALTTTIGAQRVSSSLPGISDMTSVAATVLLVASPLVTFGLMNWACVFASSAAVLVATGAKTPRTQARDRRQKAGIPESQVAVGMKGYVSADRDGEETPKKETGKEREQIRPAVSRPMAPALSSMRDARAEGELRARELQKRIRQRLNEPAVTGTTIAGGEKKKNTVVMKLRPKYINAITVEIPPGESETVEIILVNDGNAPFTKVKAYDEDLAESGFEITYGDQDFDLPAGREKIIKIRIEALKAMKDGTYSGNIVFKTENGIRSVLDMGIRVKAPEYTSIKGETEKETESAKPYHYAPRPVIEREEVGKGGEAHDTGETARHEEFLKTAETPMKSGPAKTGETAKTKEPQKKGSDLVKERVKAVMEEEDRELRKAAREQKKKQATAPAEAAPSASRGPAPMLRSAGNMMDERSHPEDKPPAKPTATEVLAQGTKIAANARKETARTHAAPETTPSTGTQEDNDVDGGMRGELQTMRRIFSALRPHLKERFLKIKKEE